MNRSLRSNGTDLAEGIKLSTARIMTHVEMVEKRSRKSPMCR